jgi:hypothetical protein
MILFKGGRATGGGKPAMFTARWERRAVRGCTTCMLV